MPSVQLRSNKSTTADGSGPATCRPITGSRSLLPCAALSSARRGCPTASNPPRSENHAPSPTKLEEERAWRPLLLCRNSSSASPSVCDRRAIGSLGDSRRFGAHFGSSCGGFGRQLAAASVPKGSVCRGLLTRNGGGGIRTLVGPKWPETVFEIFNGHADRRRWNVPTLFASTRKRARLYTKPWFRKRCCFHAKGERSPLSARLARSLSEGRGRPGTSAEWRR
jgi:hypothetical protein